jgi:PAS domain S-box-containing protein
MGWEPEELLGRSIHDFVHRARPDGTPYPQHECPVYSSRGQKMVLRMQHDLWWRKDGSIIPVEFIRAPIIEGGEVVGAVVTFHESSRPRSGMSQPRTPSAGNGRRRAAEKRGRPPKSA